MKSPRPAAKKPRGRPPEKTAAPKRKPAKTEGRGNRQYTDDFRVTALYALHLNGNNVSGTARKLGIPMPTLEKWAKGSRVPYLLRLEKEKSGDAVLAIQQSLWLLLSGVADPAAVFKAPLSQRATAFGILFDKLAMLAADPRKLDTGRSAEPAPAAGPALNYDFSALAPSERYTILRLLEKASRGRDESATVPGGLPLLPQDVLPGDGAEPGQPVQ
jgi:transposase-like protein